MFDFVRKHTKILQILLFLLIFPSFVLFGIQSYDSMRDKGPVAGTVDGREISQAEWDEAHKREVERMRGSMPNADTKMFDTPMMRYGTLERLVRERVLDDAWRKLHLQVSDARLAQTLQQDSTIASLRQPDGSLDMERYRQLLSGQGMTPEMFEARIRADLSSRQVMAGVSNSVFSTQAQADVTLKALFERREVQIARYSPADFQSQVKLSDADLDAYYQAHLGLFQAPEQVNIEYVVLDVETLKKGISLNEADLKGYYEQNASRLAGEEERRASHILIAAGKGASEAERKAARAKAEELLAAARKAPDSFADLARKNSQDTVSASQGGDLDFFRRGAMTKPFEEAAFALKKGEISAVVETEFGYHIIRLTDVKAPKVPSFEELRPKLEADLLKQQAQRKFTEVAETFTNAVYEQSDSYKAIADQLKLTVQTAQGLTRTPAPGIAGPLANPKFLASLFSADSLEKKRNTEAVEVGPSQLISARVLQHTPAHALPLAEVKDRVRTRLLAERAAELARKTGETSLAAWRTEPAKAQLPAAVSLSRDETQQQPAKLIEAVLRVDPATLPAWVGVDLGEQGYAVVRVHKVLARDANSEALNRKSLAQYTQLWSAAESLAYYRHLQERFNAKIKAPKPTVSTTPGL